MGRANDMVALIVDASNLMAVKWIAIACGAVGITFLHYAWIAWVYPEKEVGDVVVEMVKQWFILIAWVVQIVCALIFVIVWFGFSCVGGCGGKR